MSEQQSSAPVAPGQIIAGKYRIDKVLGEGGMGIVVAATHVQLQEKVAIKFLLPDALKNAEVRQRFEREARAAAKIKSEHVARVRDVGTLDNGAPYMIMEFLEGHDLQQELKIRRVLGVNQVIEYVLQACEALAEAHALGIVHRDLKPPNLFLTRRADGSPCIKLLDFGISKANQEDSAGMGMTKTSTVMGSPLYMSPEQMRSTKEVDQRTDIWALGAIMYELLSGRPPFDAETITQLCIMVIQTEPQPIQQLRPDAAVMQPIVNGCMEKDVNRRFQNVGDLANALAAVGGEPSRASADRISTILRNAGVQVSTRAIPAGGPGQTVPGINLSKQDLPPGASGTVVGMPSMPGMGVPTGTFGPGGMAPPVGPGVQTQGAWGGGAPMPMPPQQPPPASKAPIFAAIGLLVAGLGVGGFFLFGSSDEEDSGSRRRSGRKSSDDSSESSKPSSDTPATATAATPPPPTVADTATAPPPVTTPAATTPPTWTAPPPPKTTTPPPPKTTAPPPPPPPPPPPTMTQQKPVPTVIQPRKPRDPFGANRD